VQSVLNPCLPAGRGGIRDFWTFSEISKKMLDKSDGEVIIGSV
jgi:hypothetical protein